MMKGFLIFYFLFALIVPILIVKAIRDDASVIIQASKDKQCIGWSNDWFDCEMSRLDTPIKKARIELQECIRQFIRKQTNTYCCELDYTKNVLYELASEIMLWGRFDMIRVQENGIFFRVEKEKEKDNISQFKIRVEGNPW